MTAIAETAPLTRALPESASIPPKMEPEAHAFLPKPMVRALTELKRASSDDGNTLLGNRFLCRSGGLLFVGSSGIGKSTCIIQAGICWSVGRTCFDIAPRQPLKILYIQAENDDGDLAEMRDGVLEHLALTNEERDILDYNFNCVFESSRAGGQFITETLDPLLEEYSPDLVILDPVLSYIGGNANEQETVGGFLRNLVNPVLQKRRCGIVVVHHTAKPISRDGVNRVVTDYAYLGAGSAEWANWARAVLVLSTKDDHGLRELRIGKRFRLGWKDAVGQPCASRLLRQNAEGGALFYTELSAEEEMTINGKLSALDKVLRSDVLPEVGKEVSKKALVAAIAERRLCGIQTAREQVLELLLAEGYLEEFEKPRPKARPEKWVRRTDKQFNQTSFVVPGAVRPG